MRTILSLVTVAVALPGCLASPPGHLPSSVRVIYSKAVDDSLGQSRDIYFLVARSGNELQLTGDEGFDSDPDFSAGLRKVFYTREVSGARQIWSVDLDGSDERVVLSGIGEDYSGPAISPDDTRLAYVRTSGGTSSLEIVSISEEGSEQVVAGSGRWSDPMWSPDGRSLAVVGERDGASRIFVVGADGSAPRAIAPGETAAQSEPSWSPDGSRIVFKRGSGSDAEIGVIDVSTGNVTRLTDNDAEDSAPAFNPAGDRIIFTSRRPHGRWNLWVMDPDGSDVEALTRSKESDASDPEWI